MNEVHQQNYSTEKWRPLSTHIKSQALIQLMFSVDWVFSFHREYRLLSCLRKYRSSHCDALATKSPQYRNSVKIPATLKNPHLPPVFSVTSFLTVIVPSFSSMLPASSSILA
mmetsp:Transcript_24522/g.57625  ORF Transcript_24522/g.57625 Transcript_24522/m.57625 type:complete len:112 (-) Transcript_24522:813-1148(-)